ncbi:MAG: hypothetical protein OXF20_00830 [Gammaproteobacteria bacterium]|nr:hypothetical protein [Gammaproteobacteria bacterium]
MKSSDSDNTSNCKETPIENLDMPKSGMGWNELSSRNKAPREISGRHGERPYSADSRSSTSLNSTRLQLTCRRSAKRQGWSIILRSEKNIESVLHGERNLDLATNYECRIPFFDGHVNVLLKDGKTFKVRLFESEPLIFKFQNQWAGDSQMTSRLSNGHFIVIAPRGWKRVGQAPVEPDNCSDVGFQAHYFYLNPDEPDDKCSGFQECGLVTFPGIQLRGEKVFDDSDKGELYISNPPDLLNPDEFYWARVGLEAKQGWGENFKPHEKSLSSIMDDREGHFFFESMIQKRVCSTVSSFGIYAE